ncbi:MAG: ABC transporter substrate-binding protein [Candidatus ainarchaeum sp.]|nr:ABC transporter substrate-binding protein [Candidatus ainarchaeum sp.]
MKAKITLGICIIGIIAAIFIAGCAQPTQEETIKIGVSETLTGANADIGNDVANGVKDAFSGINAEQIFGKKIELLTEDNTGDVKKAVSDYQAFKMQNVRIVFSAFSSIIGALNPLSKQDKIILMYNAVTPSFAEENEFAFKVYANAPQEAETILAAIKNKNERIGIAYVNNPTTAIFYEKFSKELTEIAPYSFDIKETDFRTIILKLKEEKINTLILLGYPSQILNFVKQAVESEYYPENIFVNSDSTVKEVTDKIGDSLSGTKIKYFTVGYGLENQNYIFGYDLAKTLIEGMKKCHELGKIPDDADCLKEELKKIKIEGKSGVIDMNNSRVAVVTSKLFSVQNKKLVEVQGDKNAFN